MRLEEPEIWLDWIRSGGHDAFLRPCDLAAPYSAPLPFSPPQQIKMIEPSPRRDTSQTYSSVRIDPLT